MSQVFSIYGFGTIYRDASLYFSGPACGVVAGSKIPNYCVMSDTSNVARVMEKMGEGMRIHTSGVTKALLDQVGGFRCEYRGLLDLGVMTCHVLIVPTYLCFVLSPSEVTSSPGG